MDLVEEIIDISHELSSLKIQKLLEAISRRVPHALLPCLVMLSESCLAPRCLDLSRSMCCCFCS